MAQLICSHLSNRNSQQDVQITARPADLCERLLMVTTHAMTVTTQPLARPFYGLPSLRWRNTIRLVPVDDKDRARSCHGHHLPPQRSPPLEHCLYPGNPFSSSSFCLLTSYNTYSNRLTKSFFSLSPSYLLAVIIST